MALGVLVLGIPAYAGETETQVTSYDFEQPSNEELLAKHEQELNMQSFHKSGPSTRSASGYVELVLIGTPTQSTGQVKIAGQPPSGTSSTYGHQIYYKDGNDVSVSVSFSVGNKLINTSIGIGAQVDKSTQYSINIPGGGQRYLAYADKEVKYYVYEQYMVNPATGQKSYYGIYERPELVGIDFYVR